MWIPGHCGIEGNEQADREARKAAEGNVSAKANLPAYLGNGNFPATASAIRQHFHNSLKTRWAQRFSTSPRHGKFTAIDPKGTNSKFAENAGELWRKQTSILFQLRTGHVPLNSHLHRIGKADSPNCPHCDTTGRATIETVKHYITECPAYRKERFRL
ncbi:hypothetical protein F5879DRAFT_1073916 [Lentinula edodes]|nr:hypothetical protein F5879DRAFT_1073916 [Lentinula edodes]